MRWEINFRMASILRCRFSSMNASRFDVATTLLSARLNCGSFKEASTADHGDDDVGDVMLECAAVDAIGKSMELHVRTL